VNILIRREWQRKLVKAANNLKIGKATNTLGGIASGKDQIDPRECTVRPTVGNRVEPKHLPTG